jgi:hypothetical protein
VHAQTQAAAAEALALCARAYEVGPAAAAGGRLILEEMSSP